MQRRRAVLLLTWLVGTVLAMTLVQGSVQLLTQRVRHESLPTLDAGAIDDELQSAPAAGSIPDGTVPPDGVGATTTVPVGEPMGYEGSTPAEPGGVATPSVEPGAPPSTARPGSATPTAPRTTSPTVPQTVPATIPENSTPPSPTRTFSSIGGSIVVQCTGDAVQLVSYHPAASASARIDEWGPEEAEVRFVGPDRTTKISAECRAGVAEAEIHEEGVEDEDHGDEGARGEDD